ncbi:aminotransferase class V-fold PLP-dependent enzyme [Lacimicrobium alkaliphilum]|uniref:Selenocysteine lyase n=1 Tax=Lacimicrobium alkaliphilum TaxID=1526571 RepID=A0ABQ1RCB6_9ALTE|nr:aminotransferase class V-fold PLP-dependent enzyme [Lacimicrobium alkaliphilum]GGD62143.1 selenocysteine lyase [Lacimicrobium alkaliphilum]
MNQLTAHFQKFRNHIIGQDLQHNIGGKITPVLYADWTASGRLYAPIEEYLTHHIGPYVANTHTQTNLTGSTMTQLYHQAQQVIKRHVNADDNDALICAGSGMTTVINKLQRMMGLRASEGAQPPLSEEQKPVVFVTHMEHHSNQTTWNTCQVTVEIVNRGADGKPSETHLAALLRQYRDRPLKIGSFTACSNVTGIKTSYHTLAKIMHRHGGICLVDFACSAPYVDIDMHPEDPEEKLDAVFFSPHKFLGGPGSSGVLVFDKQLYASTYPDQPGGGTVTWTNPWGQQGFYNDIEIREDGGTPGFLQVIKVALAIQLKEALGTSQMIQREAQLTRILMRGLSAIPGVYLLEEKIRDRLCIVSFYAPGLHYNLIVRLLNDKFGIQVRGGCSCAGTYGHILLNVDKQQSADITGKIDQGDLTEKPGWVRISLHPINTDDEARFIVDAVARVIENATDWARDYQFDPHLGDFIGKQPTSLPSLTDFSPLPAEPESHNTQNSPTDPAKINQWLKRLMAGLSERNPS